MRQSITRTVAGLTAAALAASGAVGAVVVGASTAAADDAVMLENDFDSTVDPWGPRGPVELTITDDARTGAGALAVTGRTGEWNGPATDVTGLFAEGGVYQVEAWVKLPAGAADATDVHVTVQETSADGDAYTWVGGAVTATADEWVEVGGTYTMPAGLTAAQLYLEAAPVGDAHPDFLVDDVVITGQQVDAGLPDGFVPGGAVSPTSTPVSAAQSGSTGGPVAALTFDDGPNPGTTPALLDFLAAHDLPATFCVIGQNIEADGGAEILRRIVAEGHTLCNHSTGYADMGSMTPEQAQADMIANLDIIRGALGDPQAEVPFWRAPNGSWGATPGVAVNLGMQPLAVTNTIADWETQDEATLTENLRAALTDGELVLVHDGGGDRSGSLAAVETVVTERLADGWEFTPVQGTPPASGPVLSTDFEDGLDGWGPRTGDDTDPIVEITTADAASGEAAALVTGRDSQGDGIGRDVSDALTPGVRYEVSAQVRFAAGQQPDAVWLSLASTADGSTSYATLAQWSGVTADGWTEVTATFQAPAGEEQYLYLETDYNGTNTSDLLVDDVVVSVPEPAVVQDLTPIQETVPFAAGVAIDSRETSGSAADLLLRHFNQVTAENHMKPEAWYDDEGTFRPHPEAVALMDFAAANDLAMYGHVLTWHSQTPDWFFTDDAGEPLTDSAADQQVLRDRLRDHIFAVAEWLATYGEFGADNPVNAFDVVNEVVADGATDDGLRRSEWYRILGEEFIDLSFEYADEAFNHTYAAEGADRPVRLFINDYNTEQGGKQDRYVALVERMLERGVPLDGVGHQFHVSLAMPVSALEVALERFEDMPVTQAVTELDVTIGTPETQANLVEQGYWFRDAFRMFRDHAGSLHAATVWGLTDGRSWRADNGAPLLFDDAYQAKPAYLGVVDGDLPAQQRSANVFAGDVPLDGSATASPQWERLPLHQVTAAGESVAGFQLRWAADHLTAYVSVTDGAAEASDAVTFDLGGTTAVVGRDGTVTGDATAEVVETDAGYDVVAHLPLAAAAEGDTLALDVRVDDGGTSAGWNTPGAYGTLTLLEELSHVEVVEAAAAPTVDGDVDDVWTAANAVTTAQRVEGSDGAVGTFRTLWTDDTLYVLAEVEDPTVDVSGSDPWIQDSVEVFVDAGNAKNGGYRAEDTQIRVSAENEVSFGTGDAAEQAARVTSAASLTEDGYLVELSVDLLDQGGVGSFHGLDLQVNDATDGARTSVTTWADPTGTGYQYTNRWGVAELVAAPAPPAPDWEEGQVYTAGDEVTHGGALYRATWWTTEEPGTSPWGSWQEIATAPDGTAVWTASRIFVEGDVVVHEGDRYEARWWTRNQAPGSQHGPWTLLAR
ncbi:endo-1,4-beta-xylanase [Isoptericola sp. CG 20/1183]|uniref:Beta-xylanase n=1 Tax=Isoptericola halotolerans TaxID=300560 RepID=A0ABX5EGT7_9MICO|nr:MULTISPECIES: endo-1,4-beta-xylanase [Isoptericola]PRZ06436.1 endo-1,4-beta-xylanase [Isoptericola halotolerans]PRZ06758.1 endo-1,4-beta-xylanase [Isoptericola sp. CG 20/1183]